MPETQSRTQRNGPLPHLPFRRPWGLIVFAGVLMAGAGAYHGYIYNQKPVFVEVKAKERHN